MHFTLLVHMRVQLFLPMVLSLLLNISQNICWSYTGAILWCGNVTLDFATYQIYSYLNREYLSCQPHNRSSWSIRHNRNNTQWCSARTVSLSGTDYRSPARCGVTLSNGVTTDLIPYMVADTGRILLGTPQLAFA